jgi:hypothetical protein
MSETQHADLDERIARIVSALLREERWPLPTAASVRRCWLPESDEASQGKQQARPT